MGNGEWEMRMGNRKMGGMGKWEVGGGKWEVGK